MSQWAKVVSFTPEAHWRSRRVMERIEMTQDLSDDFDHPSLPSGSRLRRHVLYRKARPPGQCLQAAPPGAMMGRRS